MFILWQILHVFENLKFFGKNVKKMSERYSESGRRRRRKKERKKETGRRRKRVHRGSFQNLNKNDYVQEVLMFKVG